MNKKNLIILSVFLSVFLIGNVFSQTVNSSTTYTVDELVKSELKEGTEILVRGRFNAELISAGSDYEGPGGGNYLFGETESILLQPQEALHGLELNQIIVVKGKVGYCGGIKVSRYICRLSNVEFIQKDRVQINR